MAAMKFHCYTKGTPKRNNDFEIGKFSLYFINLLFFFFIFLVMQLFNYIIEALHDGIDHLYSILCNAESLSKYTFNISKKEFIW